MNTNEPVGSLADEAARLFTVVQGLLASDGADESDLSGAPSSGTHAGGEGRSDECGWCPLCRLVQMARGTSPEVRAHLHQAALSATLAVQALLETRPDPQPESRRDSTDPFETIALSDDE